MQCQQCSRPALVMVGKQGEIPLCLDCYSKLQDITDRKMENTERRLNFLAAQYELTAGVPGFVVPRFPERRPRIVLRKGDITMHNVQIDRGNIGILNTGYIGAVDTAIGALRSAGDAAAAKAFLTLTEHLAQLQDGDAEQKNRLLEVLSVLASEGALPREQRRKSAAAAHCRTGNADKWTGQLGQTL